MTAQHGRIMLFIVPMSERSRTGGPLNSEENSEPSAGPRGRLLLSSCNDESRMAYFAATMSSRSNDRARYLGGGGAVSERRASRGLVGGCGGLCRFCLGSPARVRMGLRSICDEDH